MGSKFKELPNVCIIFISRFDLFGGNVPFYHIDRVIRETGIVTENGFEEIYVNAKVRDTSEVSQLMEIFLQDDVYNDKFPVTSNRKRQFKETEQGQNEMCEIMETIAQQERAEGRAEGKLETLYSLVKQGLLSLTEGAAQANINEETFQLNMNKVFPA